MWQMVGTWMAPNVLSFFSGINTVKSCFLSFFFFRLFSPAVGKDFILPRVTPAGLCREILQIGMDFNATNPQQAAAALPPGRSCPAI